MGLDSEDDPLLNADTMKMLSGDSGGKGTRSYRSEDDERVLQAV